MWLSFSVDFILWANAILQQTQWLLMLIKSAIRLFLTKMATKKQKNCENLLSCHFTFSMNTYKTLKSFSLTSTKMWVGGWVMGREGVTGGCRSERLCSGVLNPGFHVHLGLFFFFFFCSLKKNPKNLYEQLRFPIIFLNHVVPSFESYQYLKLTTFTYRPSGQL